MTTPVLPVERGYCEISNIRIEKVEAVGAKKIFTADGLPDKLIRNVAFSNISAAGDEAGTIEFAKDWRMQNVKIKTAKGENVTVTNSQNVDAPAASKR
jgi:hypothetical protein